MNIPEQVKIAGSTYTIEQKDFSKDLLEHQNDGMLDHFHQKIFIDKNISADRKEVVLIHEILEAINENNELGLPHQTLRVLETSLHQVIKDNHKVFMPTIGESDEN